jgi:hypothetical protein
MTGREARLAILAMVRLILVAAYAHFSVSYLLPDAPALARVGTVLGLLAPYAALDLFERWRREMPSDKRATEK